MIEVGQVGMGKGAKMTVMNVLMIYVKTVFVYILISLGISVQTVYAMVKGIVCSV